MASEQIVLFDLASRPPRSTWSLNPWKSDTPPLDQNTQADKLTARLLLNYKGLNYRTEWLEYPEIQPRLQGQYVFFVSLPPVLSPSNSHWAA